MKTFADKALARNGPSKWVDRLLVIIVMVLIASTIGTGTYIAYKARKPKITPDILIWSTGNITIADPMPPEHLTINGSRWILETYDFQIDPDATVRDSKGNVIGYVGAMTSCVEHKIWYDPFKPAALFRDNLWHEITHAELCNEDDKTVRMVSGVNNLTHDHCIVYWLGMSNSVFVHDNPEFMKWAENW